MRTHLLFGLAVVFALAVVTDVEATWPRRDWRGTYYGGPTPTPTYVSGVIIGGPMYASDMNVTGTVVEQTGPFGFVRRRVVLSTPPAVVTMAPTTPPSTGVVPAGGTTPATESTGVTTSGYLLPGTLVEQRGPFGFLRRRVVVTPATPVVPAAGATTTPSTGVVPAGGTTPATPATESTGVTTSGYLQPGTVVEQRGPFGFLRRRVVVTPATPVVPAAGTSTTPNTGVVPAGGTTPSTKSPEAATKPGGVVTGGYVVPAEGTTTVVPARYTWRPFFRSRMTMVEPSTVVPAANSVPSTTTETYYYYPQYRTGRYFGWSGFGFSWR